MATENPREPDSPIDAELVDSTAESNRSDRESSKAFADLVFGPNLRLSDNLFQALFILVVVLLFSAVGGVAAAFYGEEKLPWYGGALLGAFAGLGIGFLVSGTILMIYRAVRHMRGKHD